jgi:hypothetical protein
LSQFRKRHFDPREYWGLSELREYPLCFGKMLKRERSFSFDLIQKAKNHLRPTYVLPGAIELWIVHDARSQGTDSRRRD